MVFQLKSKILCNRRVQGNYFHLIIGAPKVAKEATPGQFLNIKVSNGSEPLLRRPLGVHRVKGENIELLYEVVGEGTKILSQKKVGEYLDIIGPLGKGFSYPAPSIQHQASILVAGGIGVAPLLFLVQRLKKVTGSKSQVTSIILIGAKTKNQLLCEREFKELGGDVKIATDDGSKGFKGKVSELLGHILRKNLITQQYNNLTMKQFNNVIYACGPHPMLQEIAGLSQKYKIPAQVSLEEHMACGIGACLGCAVETTEGYKRICKEGPVFLADEIIWK